MQIWELETKNGRVFRVAVANKSQEKRLLKVVHNNKSKSYETFIRVEVVKSGVHDINQFEALANSLQ